MNARSDRAGSFNGATGFSADCGSGTTLGFCLVAFSGPQVWNLFLNPKSPDFVEDKGVPYGTHSYVKDADSHPPLLEDSSKPGGVAAQPKYLTEVDTRPYAGDSVEFNDSFKNPRYRITALGFGSSTEAQVLVQEVVKPH